MKASSEVIICPVCKGRGQLDAHARRYTVGLCTWVEKSCKCCAGDTVVTQAHYRQYQTWQAIRREAAQHRYFLLKESA